MACPESQLPFHNTSAFDWLAIFNSTTQLKRIEAPITAYMGLALLPSQTYALIFTWPDSHALCVSSCTHTMHTQAYMFIQGNCYLITFTFWCWEKIGCRLWASKWCAFEYYAYNFVLVIGTPCEPDVTPSTAIPSRSPGALLFTLPLSQPCLCKHHSHVHLLILFWSWHLHLQYHLKKAWCWLYFCTYPQDIGRVIVMHALVLVPHNTYPPPLVTWTLIIW